MEIIYACIYIVYKEFTSKLDTSIGQHINVDSCIYDTKIKKPGYQLKNDTCLPWVLQSSAQACVVTFYN